MSYYTLKEEKVEETINESFEFLLWTLKLYSKFNENFRKNFDGKVVTIKGDFDSNTLKIYTQINKIQNNKFKDNFKLTEFNFLPYINESGVIETQANGETNYNHINNNYIGSVFRAVMESYYQTSIYNNYPKFREYPLDEKQSLYLLTKEGNKYYKKVNNFETSADLWLESYNKVYLNNFFVSKIENYKDNLIFSNKTINSLNEVVKKLKDKPNLLEKFYSLEDIKNSEEKIKEIKIGHLSNNTHNEKAYEYVYNKNDILKKGILILKATRPLFLKKEIENNASKTPLLNQATLICTAGSEYPKFVVTSNTNFKIQNLSVGLSSDKIGGKNIPAFGSCIFKKEGCKCPAISSEWSNQSEALLVNNQKLLTVASTISCDVGGTILVQENGTDITDKSIIK